VIAVDSSVLVDLMGGGPYAEGATVSVQAALHRGPVVVCDVVLAEVCTTLKKISAHALMQCDALITRDAGFFRDYFKGPTIIVPSAG
jgi:predicted nucleic acid-binding protein